MASLIKIIWSIYHHQRNEGKDDFSFLKLKNEDQSRRKMSRVYTLS